MSVVLVVEPDAAQAAAVRKMQRRLGAELVLVSTTDEAIESIELGVPDLILLSALLSPRDEDRLIKFLRSLDDASHLQTLTIPQLRTAAHRQADDSKGKKGLFRKKREASAPTGCDPDVFAEEIAAQLSRASEIRHRPRVVRAKRITEPQPAEPLVEPAIAELFAANQPAGQTLSWPKPGEVPVQRETFAPSEGDVFAQPEVLAQPEVFAPSGVFAQPEVLVQPETFVQPEAFVKPEALVQPEAFKPVEPLIKPQVIAEPEPAIEPAIHEPTVSQMMAAGWNKLKRRAAPVPPPPPKPKPVVEESELEQLARELGVSLDAGMTDVDVQDDASAERVAAEVALVKAETETKLAAELERVRAEAEGRRLSELARLQADADAARKAAIAEARAAAEEETRKALASEVARVRSEAEGTVAEAVSRVKIEAEQTLSQEIGRAREDTETLRADLARAQQEAAVTARALEAEVARVRGQAESHLKAELERIGKEAEHARAADQSHAKKTAEQIREAAAREARAIAEEAARQTLAAEISRVRSQAETILETEVARVRADAQERQTAELLQLRVQMDAMRKAAAEQANAAAEQARAAAEHARAAEQTRAAAEQARAAERARAAAEQVRAAEQARAAAEQVRAAEQARAAAEQVRVAEQARAAAEHARVVEQARAAAARRPADVISFPIDSTAGQRAYEYEEEEVETAEVEEDTPLPQSSTPGDEGGRRDYYSLWQKDGKDASAAPHEATDEEARTYNYARWLKWGLPIAASILLVAISGIDTIARLATPAPAEPAPARVVKEVPEKRAPVAAAPVESKFGTLKVESTPAGAQITLDGESRGVTPQTISNLKPGAHELVLHSASGAINRHVTIKAGQTAIASEAIFAGWLAIFAPIKLDISLNGVATAPTDDGRFMIAPGTYKVNMVNSRFNFHHTETLVVKPGEVTAHTVSLPTGLLKISVPDGTEVSVDGHTIGKAPFSEVLPLVVGTHEVMATHPELGAKRTTVDVKFEETTETTLTLP